MSRVCITGVLQMYFPIFDGQDVNPALYQLLINISTSLFLITNRTTLLYIERVIPSIEVELLEFDWKICKTVCLKRQAFRSTTDNDQSLRLQELCMIQDTFPCLQNFFTVRF
ncbi:Hypothetical_protein [Hexamita inflata]|uniref:Hypothetical_protein n=1 Tax=Hexamita inflata TaxID=28002 RepID=A0AA86NB27_9EUKA|nr:Hypothetical protein HINF_LOCUS3561 [Hexamita inflata]